MEQSEATGMGSFGCNVLGWRASVISQQCF
ncbi:hypothetical protein BAE44_0012036 [Dichanthelium oligosanthes]|uniref:Uncharacterized protein n=1 Tax=Dichanthelium oligosanthes TaxID=888268 RepID=A0A1E5VPF0_9POAL|nr:hypothetical protein BAE44_0012036 [Dichanthelium oligosanthes]